jgi:hypothetical protein
MDYSIHKTYTYSTTLFKNSDSIFNLDSSFLYTAYKNADSSLFTIAAVDLETLEPRSFINFKEDNVQLTTSVCTLTHEVHTFGVPIVNSLTINPYVIAPTSSMIV